MLEKPPEEKDAAVSVMPVVAPTDVRLSVLGERDPETRRSNLTYKGQPEGKVGMNDEQL